MPEEEEQHARPLRPAVPTELGASGGGESPATSPRTTPENQELDEPEELRRSLSEEVPKCTSAESDQLSCDMAKIGLTRSNTWSMHAGTRRQEAADLPPDAVAKLHKLHENFLKYSGGSSNVSFKLDTSFESLDQNWDKGGAWHVWGTLPSGSERPLRTRGLSLLPTTLSGAQSILGNNGMAAVNTKGSKGTYDSSVGQDNFSFTHLSSGWEVLCVMDGHGKDGEWPATRAVRTMPYFLAHNENVTQMLKNDQVEAALIFAFDHVQKDLVSSARREQVDIQASGCTAVTVMWNKGSSKLWVGTAGDSRAVLLVPGKGAVAETKDHKPMDEGEAKRIEEMGGEVTITQHDDGFVDCRVNLKGQEYPGISMSRSLGDLSVKDCGVIAEPEVVVWDTKKYRQDALVLAASDGVWEFLSTETVASMVLDALAAGKTHLEALELLLQAAREQWKEKEGEYCDDITAVLVSLDGRAKVSHRQAKGGSGGGGACMEGLCHRCVVA
mmetsp:Transcript_65158/g.168132  ORF Transcript_65158/g.168132 Transcript_65158/m.168132 type:complete len:498 (-) Transcript_65158:125-1618(-)